MVIPSINQSDIISPRDERILIQSFHEAYQIALESSSDPRMIKSPMLNSRIGQNIYMNVNDFLQARSDDGELEGEVVWQPALNGGCGHAEYRRNGYSVTISRVKGEMDPPRKSNYRYQDALCNQDEMVGLGMNFKSVFTDEDIPNGHKFRNFCITHGTNALSMIRLVLPGLDDQDRVVSVWRGENWIDQSYGLPPIVIEDPIKPIEPKFKLHLVEEAKKKLNE